MTKILITEFINQSSLENLNKKFDVKYDEKLCENEKQLIKMIKDYEGLIVRNKTQVNSKIDMVLKNFPLPNGYSYRFGGEQQEQEEEMAFLSNAFMIALFLVFIIIVAQFNKIVTPLIIMSSIILSTIGVFLGLLIFSMDFVVVMTMIGVISLIGIVVNNAIVLIDFIELNRRRKKLNDSKKSEMQIIIESITEAGKTRLRPVLLTALTTILGLMPLAIGMNFDFVSFF